MLRNIALGCGVILLFVLQTTLLKDISFLPVTPNLLIILTSSVGFMRGRKAGLWAGFFCGLLMDIFYGELLGIYALFYMWAGYANGKLCRYFYPQDIKLPMSAIAFSDLGVNILIYFFLFLFRGRTSFLFYFINIMVPELVMTLIFMIGLYFVILKAFEFFNGLEKRSA
ncbi:MAG: rod shape-determining protein MreD [Lachnospiraceae bacterium]|nr:rod shape-determining protein MreD [Lachnospiraceae bacterium]